MAKVTKKTVLHDWHKSHSAVMAHFGGYDMPLWYASAKHEHLSVLQTAGLFDTSHMSVLLVRGSGAHDLLQLCFTNNLDACIGKDKKPLAIGHCVYGAYLDEEGRVIDDTIIAKLSNADYMAVVNAGMGGVVAEHLRAHGGGRDVSIIDLTDRLGKIDIQGPMAARIMSKVLASPQTVFQKMPYFSFKGHFDASSPQSDAVRLTDNTPILLSRTGYTGEFGFEIFVSPERLQTTWDTIYQAGRAFDIAACGLAARDSLRAGALLPLSHQDIGAWPYIHHPWPFALPFNAERNAFTKTFIGDGALLQISHPEYTYAFIGEDPRKVSPDDPALVLDPDRNEIGRVLSCVSDMGIGYHQGRLFSIASPDRPPQFKPSGLSCGFIKVNLLLRPGAALLLKDKRRELKVKVVADIRPDRTARRPIAEMV